VGRVTESDSKPKRLVPASEVAPFPRDRLIKFLSKVRIQSKDYGLINFQLLGTQLYVLVRMEEAIARGITKFVILKARQLGMSTFFLGLDLFWAFENQGLLGAFVTHTEQSKAQFRNILKVFLANLPRGYKKDAVQENRDMVVFENGSLFQYIVAGVREKGKGGIGRSSANNFAHCTEVAFWGSADDVNELAATMSTHYQHRLEVYESTANGFNHFHEMWEAAKEDPTCCAIFVGWWLHDHYSYGDDHPFFQIYMPDGHATKLNALERKRVKDVRDQFGVDITHNQIAWYRWQLEAKQQGDQSKMDELYPWTEQDAFVATGSRFFTNESLTDAMKRTRSVPYMPFRYILTDRWHETGVTGGNRSRHDLKIWEEAVHDGWYVIGCDPAYGSSDDADRSVIHVARCFADRMVQVAEFVSTSTSTYQCAWVLAHLAGYYRNCMVNLEISGPGTTVFQELNHLRTSIKEIKVSTNPEDTDLRNVLRNAALSLQASRLDAG